MKKLFLVMAIAGLLISGFVLAQDEKPRGGSSETKPEPELKVEEAVIAKDIDREKREPVEPGERFSAEVGKLYCFTKITGAKEETEIKHIWYLEDKVMSEITLAVKAERWRTWSNKTIDQTMKGNWRVEVKDSKDNLLATLNFTIE